MRINVNRTLLTILTPTLAAPIGAAAQFPTWPNGIHLIRFEVAAHPRKVHVVTDPNDRRPDVGRGKPTAGRHRDLDAHPQHIPVGNDATRERAIHDEGSSNSARNGGVGD